MDYKLNDKELTVYFSGRIDSTNAARVEQEIEAIRQSNAHESIVVDADKLEYISSAGLRIVLRLLKSERELKIINVTSDVYEVFDMTGFTEMAQIEKGYRHISIEGCEVIGEGANGKVYRTDPDTIVKVYMNPDSLPDIKRERELARKAFVLGIPTAIPFDIVRVGDTYGSVFELLNAKSFAKLIEENPGSIDKYISLSVDLLKKIHSAVVDEGDMPDIKIEVIEWGEYMNRYLSSERYEKLMRMIKEVPNDYHMMHGDFHIKNIMMQNDEVLLIDMDTLCHGNPIFEFAGTYNALVGFSLFDNNVVRKFLGITYDQGKYMWKRTMELYFEGKAKEEIEAISSKAELIGNLRIVRRIFRHHFEETTEGKKELDSRLDLLGQQIDKLDNLLI